MELNIQTPKAVKAATSKFNRLTARAEAKTAAAFREYCDAAEQVRVVVDWYSHPDTKAEAKEAGGKLPPLKEYLPAALGKGYSTLRRYVQVSEAIDGGASVEEYLTAEAAAAAETGNDLQVSQLRFLRWVNEGTLEVPPTEVEETAEDGAEGAAEDGAEDTPADGVVRVRSKDCVLDWFAEAGKFEVNGAGAIELMDALAAAWIEYRTQS